MTTHPIERRSQSRRKSDRRSDDLLKTFSTPQCRLCLENFVGAVLLLGQKREVFHATASMKALASKSAALLTINPKLQLLDAQKDAQLTDFFDGSTQTTSPFVLPLSDDTVHHKLLLTCFRLPKTQSSDATSAPRFMIKCRINEPYDTHQWHFFVTQYNLSDAEIKLCQALMDGLTLEECRLQWGVTVNTLKTQLKSVFIKTSTHRQVDLLRLIYLMLQA